jgi:putative restriction endonuclease
MPHSHSPFFLLEKEWIPIPESWSRHIQQGRTYDTAEGDGRRLWDLITDRVNMGATIALPRYGEPVLIHPRLGQGGFRMGVTGVYQRRCAVTGERTLPILDAAHIRPYGAGGGHEIKNGLLLRTDVHRLFDLGYVTVGGDGHFQVGRRLKENFENGRHYYAMHGQPITCRITRSYGPPVMRLNGISRINSSVDRRKGTTGFVLRLTSLAMATSARASPARCLSTTT